MTPPPDPQPDADELATVLHYLNWYEMEFTRGRLKMKRRASRVVVWNSILTGLVAVVGAVTTYSGLAWLGVVSAALAGMMGVITSWDALFRHRELWILRSITLSELQALKRRIRFDVARGADRSSIAIDGIQELERILAEDLDNWGDIRRKANLGQSQQ